MDNLLETNRFIPGTTQSSGYGLSQELRDFRFRQHIEQQQQQINLSSLPPPADLEDDDLMNTNPALGATGQPSLTGQSTGGSEERPDMMGTHVIPATGPGVISGHPTFKGQNQPKPQPGRIVKEIKTKVNINSLQRQLTTLDTVERNPETGLYTRDVVDSDTGQRHVQLYNADILNNETSLSATEPPKPYFTQPNGNIAKKRYQYARPDNYKISLPRKFTNVKSVRLTSVEVPNSLNLVTPYNNLILLDILDVDTGSSIELKSGASPYSFLLFQLTPGSYTLAQLATHMQTVVNDLVREASVEEFADLFTITIDSTTGQVSISLTDPSGFDLKFHWRFWFRDDLDGTLPVTEYTNLWYLLGFAQAYETTSDGSDRYTKVRTNLLGHGVNPLISGQVDNLSDYRLRLPYRQPIALPHKYIYLSIKELGGSFTELFNPDITNFNQPEHLFAKVVLNVPAGQTTHEFESNSKVFESTLPHLEELTIQWLDFAGQPVDFQQTEHSFTLEIIEYSDQLEDTRLDSRRGISDQTSYPAFILGGT